MNLSGTITGNDRSRPARGGWIEIQLNRLIDGSKSRLAPRGAGGLKYGEARVQVLSSVSPREGRVD